MGEVTGDAERVANRIDWAQVRLIFQANWKTYFNRVTSRPWAIVANILAVMAFGFYALVLSVALGAFILSHRDSDPVLAAAAVHYVFLIVFFILAVTPVLGFRGNEFLDVTKLFGLPVGHRTVFAATLCCLMGSLSVVIFSLPLAAAALAYSHSVGEAFAGLGATVLFVIVAVAVGQFFQLLFLTTGTLKSRKFRDAMMVIVPLLIAGVYGLFNYMSQSHRVSGAFEGIIRWFSTWRRWTLPSPSWWAAHTITGEGWTRWAPVLGLVALLAWLIRASAVLEEKAFLGEVEEEAPVEGVAGKGPIARLASRIPDPLGALVEKEIAILRREPAVRSMLIGQTVLPILWGVAAWSFLQKRLAEGGLERFAPLGGLAAFAMVWMEMGLVMNLLGLEGGGAVHAMLLPVPRKLLLMGKNVAYLLVFGTLNGAVAVIVTVVLHVLARASVGSCVLYSLIGFVEGYLVVAVAVAIGDVTSVLTPIRVAVRDRRALRQQLGGREGCLWSLLRMFALFGTLFLAAPIALLLHLPRLFALWHGPALPEWTVLVGLPVAAAFAFGLMHLGAWVGGSLLATREEEVVTRLSKSDE